jgi:hypothetical protein
VCGGCNTSSPIIETLVKVGQNGTDICLKFKVKVGKLWLNLPSLAYFGRKIYKYAYISLEKFLTPPADNISSL